MTKCDGHTYCNDQLGESYTDIWHDSGMRILLCHKPMKTAYAMLGVGFGALDTDYCLSGKTVHLPFGVAHYLEHRMFGNPDGRDATADFAACGADVNAFTGYDKTAYLFSTATQFDDCLEKLLRFVTEPYFPAEAVDAERPIIAEEIRMSLDDPYEQGYAAQLRGLYAEGAIREDICGTLASVGRITPEILCDTYDAFYRPDELILCVCGDVTPEEVCKVADRCMPAHTPRRERPVRLSATKPNRHLSDVSIRMPVAKPIFNFALRLPEADRASVPAAFAGRRRLLYRDTVLSVIAEALFSRAGTFYSGLLEEGLIRPGFSYGSTVLRDLSYLAVSGESDCVLEVYQRFCAYLENVRKNGISKEDFERARRVMYADFVTAFDSTEDVASMLFSAAVDGIGLFESLDMIERVTVSDANALLDRECLQENMQLTVVEPLADGESEGIENGDTD